METITLSQAQQGADRQTAQGAREKGEVKAISDHLPNLKKKKPEKLRPAKPQ